MQSGAIVAALAVTGLSTSARADQLEGIERVVAAVELAIPDVRFEHSFTRDANRWVLAFPVVLRAGHVGVGGGGLVFNHQAELHYNVSDSELRGVLGERMLLHAGSEPGLMPFVELAGLLGQDGHGAVVGAGLAWGDWESGVSAGLVLRYAFTGDERRGDVSFDVQVPFNAP